MTKNAMEDRLSAFSRATKEADQDFSALGQAVLSAEVNPDGNGLLYRSWHLRDVAWAEDVMGQITTIHRKWKPTVADLVRMFPKTVHNDVREKLADGKPFHEINVRHVVMPSELYSELHGGKKFKQPYVGCFIDCDNDHEMECVGLWTKHYIIPRWSTVAGSQYAHSPAVVAALADARLIQEVSRVLLEAGEKATTPPMVGVQEAIRGDISVFAGGITWVDAEYDERLGDVLRPITQDKSGLAFGMEMIQDLRQQISDAFFLNRLNLPPTGGPDMTAYEVSQRVQEYIRNALPLFEPMEQDYNGQLCEQTFELLMRNVPEMVQSMPPQLQGADIKFLFESPLTEATEKLKVGQYMEAQQILAQAIQLDPSVALMVDNHVATRDVISAITPAAWIRDEKTTELMAQQQAKQQEQQQLLQAMQQGADVAKTVKEASPTVGPGGMAA